MGAADFDDVRETLRPRHQGALQRIQRRQKRTMDRKRRGDVHRRGETVVGGLAEIDVVIGMDWRLRPAHARSPD